MIIPEDFRIEGIKHPESGYFIWRKWDWRTNEPDGWEMIVDGEFKHFPDLDAVRAWIAENPKFKPEVPKGEDIPF